MKTETEISAERSKLRAEIDSIQAQRKPLVELYALRRISQEQDEQLVKLTTSLDLRHTQMKVLDWVCGSGTWSILNWETIG